jgi:hypothetical protein
MQPITAGFYQPNWIKISSQYYIYAAAAGLPSLVYSSIDLDRFCIINSMAAVVVGKLDPIHIRLWHSYD